MYDDQPDYYEILQVSPDAEQEVIEAAYRRLARKYHPDVNRDARAVERMRQLNEAFEILGDPAKRADYEAGRKWFAEDEPRKSAGSKYAVPTGRRQARINPVALGFVSAVTLTLIGLVVGVTLVWLPESNRDDQDDATAVQPSPSGLQPLETEESLEPIDVRRIFESIEDRYVGPPGFLNFGEWEYADLTGDGEPEVLVRWNEGGNCGYFAEVWGYYRGNLSNLTPTANRQVPNDFGCGGVEAEDLLDVSRKQVVITFRTYSGSGPEADVYQSDIFCWNGAIFVLAAVDYRDSNGNEVRPRLEIIQRDQCT